MQIPIRMPDERLAAYTDVYGHWPVPMKDISTFSPGLIAFNLSGVHLEVNGEVRTEPVIMGISTEPTHIRYSIDGGDLVSLRVRSSAYDLLFDIDPSAQSGIVAMDPARHPRLAQVHEALKAAPPIVEGWFEALDKVLLDLLPLAKPAGLVGRMIETSIETDGTLGVAEMADRLGCTVRTLERACKRRFGRSPKRLLRGHRLSLTMQREALAEERVELMPDFAYADLPHYLNEMRKMTGLNRKQMSDAKQLGNDFPYVYVWPDGSVAETQEEQERWHAEMARRYRTNPG